MTSRGYTVLSYYEHNGQQVPVDGGPLCGAAYNGHANIVRLLLANGADANGIAAYEKSGVYDPLAIDCADFGLQYETSPQYGERPNPSYGDMPPTNYVDVFHILQKSTTLKVPLLNYAAGHCLVSLMRLALNDGAPVNGRDSEDGTALMRASGAVTAGDCTEGVQMLLQHGAWVNATEKHGYTALHFAVSTDYDTVDVAEILIKHGANRISKSTAPWGDIPAGSTPLDIAQRYKETKTIALLAH